MPKCKFGVVIKIVFEDERKAVLIASPTFRVTADEVAEEFRQQGYEVSILNTGVEEEDREAEELLNKYCFNE